MEGGNRNTKNYAITFNEHGQLKRLLLHFDSKFTCDTFSPSYSLLEPNNIFQALALKKYSVLSVRGSVLTALPGHDIVDCSGPLPAIQASLDLEILQYSLSGRLNLSTPTGCITVPADEPYPLILVSAMCGPMASPEQEGFLVNMEVVLIGNLNMIFQESGVLKTIQQAPTCATTSTDDWADAFTLNQLGYLFYFTQSDNTCYGFTNDLANDNLYKFSFQPLLPGPVVDCSTNSIQANYFIDSYNCSTLPNPVVGTGCFVSQFNNATLTSRCRAIDTDTSTATLPLPAILGISIGGFFLLLLLVWRWRRGKGV